MDDVQKACDDFEVGFVTARGGHSFYNSGREGVDLEENAAFQNFLLSIM